MKVTICIIFTLVAATATGAGATGALSRNFLRRRADPCRLGTPHCVHKITEDLIIKSEAFGYGTANKKVDPKIPSLGDVSSALFKDKTQQPVRFRSSRVLPGFAPSNSMYSRGSPYGRGNSDNMNNMYGHFGSSYGPMGGPAMNGWAGGSPQWVDPRGFNMDWNRTKEIDLGNQRGILPGFGKPMFPGSPFPARYQGGNGLNQYGAPPFTGKPVTAMSPNGPFVIDGIDSNTGGQNTTLMGPLPFGPYGGSPYVPFSGGQLPMAGGPGGGGVFPNNNMMMQSGGAMMMGGQNVGAMGAGVMTPGNPFGGQPMVGSLGQQAIPGLHPAVNPFTALHHASMFPMQGQGMGAMPGLVNGMGQGYPHPDWDRYHSVMPIPPGPFGGGGAEAAAAR